MAQARKAGSWYGARESIKGRAHEAWTLAMTTLHSQARDGESVHVCSRIQQRGGQGTCGPVTCEGKV